MNFKYLNFLLSHEIQIIRNEQHNLAEKSTRVNIQDFSTNYLMNRTSEMLYLKLKLEQKFK